jgi:hypothetical protein
LVIDGIPDQNVSENSQTITSQSPLMSFNSTLSESDISFIEARLNSDHDALISSVIANENVDTFLDQLQFFIDRKKSDISTMCDEHSSTFAQSIEGAQILGSNAVELRRHVLTAETAVKQTVQSVELNLSESITFRGHVKTIDAELFGISEGVCVVQQLKNINDEIDRKNYYVALVRCIEFQDYDSPISTSTMVLGFQREVEDIIKHIIKQAEYQMKEFLASYMKTSISVGSAYLYGTAEPILSFAPLYENYMVKKHLGQLAAFREYYFDMRSTQAKKIISEGPLSAPVKRTAEDIERLKALFSAIAGFFLIETRISWDRFTLIPQGQLDEMWRGMLESAYVPLASLNHQMMNVAKHVTLFCEKMEQCSLSCAPFQSFIAKQARPFKSELMREFQTDIRKTLEENSAALMIFQTPDEYTPIAKFCLCEVPTRYPYEAKFVWSIPKVLTKVETALHHWSEFSGKVGDRLYIETFEILMSNAIVQIGTIGTTLPQIPNVGFIFSSIICLQSVLSYFDQWIQQISTAGLRPDIDKLRKKIQEQLDLIMDHIKDLFRKIIGELLIPQTFRQMCTGKPPHDFSFELVTFLETMSASLRPILPAGMFLKIIEFVAGAVGERFAEVIVATTDMKWNANLIWAAQQNLNNIENWPTLIALPSARQQLNGRATALAKLLSNQLSGFVSDPQFIQQCKGLPVDAMIAILSRYGTVKTKEHFVIPNDLVKTLIQKLSPLSKMSGKGKK